MKRIIAPPLIALTSLLGAQLAFPALAQQQPAALAGNLQPGLLLPPRVDHVALRASSLRLGMPAAEVERIMGAAVDVETHDGTDDSVRVLRYPREPIATKVTIADGKVFSVALDIAGVDERAMPAYTAPAWLRLHRAALLRMLGTPAEDRLHDRFGMTLEHMIFERSGQPDISIFLIGQRVVTKRVGRSLPPDLFVLALPLPADPAGAETDARGDAHDNKQIRIGMTARDVRALFGEPKLSVPSSFKGRPVEYALFETSADGAFARFTFIDGTLVEFAHGGRTPLSQILRGG
jgi:hypothetical protein